MPHTTSKIVLVDTNCFIRLFHSSAQPIFGHNIGGYTLLTLDSLVNEYLTSESLIKQYPWIAQEPRLSDLKNAKLTLRKPLQTGVANQLKELRPYATAMLESHCKNQKITLRTLSKRDLELLATCVALKCIMATDEWPLRHIAKDLMSEPDEYSIGLLNSMELLQLLEMNNKISSEQRRVTVDSWIRNREKLLNGWQDDYKRLFNESADELGK